MTTVSLRLTSLPIPISEDSPTFRQRATNPYPASSVISIILMGGDPSPVPGQSYSVGKSTNAGVSALLSLSPPPSSPPIPHPPTPPKPQVVHRPNLSQIGASASRTQSYRDANDMYCDSEEILAVHQGYVSEYGDAAIEFFVGLVRA